ncbi:MAG TPA: type II toxin-antitoxin system VapC family toxin [Acidimicrobiales bacterium]|jgi:predicted nucleic acid-binding protein
MNGEHVVIDAAALLDLMLAWDVGMLLETRLEGRVLHAPGHIDAEVLSGLGHLERAGVLSSYRTLEHLETLAVAPIERHPVAKLLEGAWGRRHDLRLSDALYVELARSLGVALITTDPSLAGVASPIAELITQPRASERKDPF